MLFNQVSVKNKLENKDKILEEEELFHSVVSEYMMSDFEINPVDRIWDGGGASLFILQEGDRKIFLKVKSSNVMVESQLEEEEGFIDESALFHEYKMLTRARKAGVNVPDIVFFVQRGGYDFLAIEYIADTLLDALKQVELEEEMQIWDKLVKNVNRLYDAGIVHCDLHEKNIRYADGNVYLIDFEDARFLHQSTTFEKSLDYIGYNNVTTLGKYPLYMEQDYTIPYNCLSRLKEVFNEIIAEKAFEYTKMCNYDSTNGICTTLDHGRSNKIYQGIRTKYFVIGGQRSANNRIRIITRICEILLDNRFAFVDIGSNNGLFGREIAKHVKNATRCIGLEGFHNFNVLARSIAFIEDIYKTEYYDFVCGEDDISKLHINGPVALSICSVWHHIKEKEKFLEQLKNLDIECIFMEFATQSEIYNGRSWEEEVEFIRNFLGLRGKIILGKTEDYDRPFVLLTKEVLNQDKLQEVLAAQKKALEYSNSDDDFGDGFNKDKVDNKRYWVCFGAGLYGRKAIQFLEGNIAFFIDNNPDKVTFEKYKVVSPEKAVELLDKNATVIISTSPQYYDEIRRELSILNVHNVITFDELMEKGRMLCEGKAGK